MTPQHCRAARGWLNWTQTELARRSGVGTTAIKSLENGQRNPHRGTLALIELAFAKAGVKCSAVGVYSEDAIFRLDKAGPGTV